MDFDMTRPVDNCIILFLSQPLCLFFIVSRFFQPLVRALVKWRVTLVVPTVLSEAGQCGLVSGLRSFLLSEEVPGPALTRDTQL